MNCLDDSNLMES